MTSIELLIDDTASRTGFSGVVGVHRDDVLVAARAVGFADRRHGIPNALDTRFSIASATKGFTALVVLSLVVDGSLTLDTTARSVLGDDLPLIDPGVTVQQLLAHRSGIGDYLDESALGDVDDHVMAVPVHELSSTESYLAVLDGFRQREPPGTTSRYNNGGFVVLAILAERAAGVPFEQLVGERVVEPAEMSSTGFLRSDSLPADVAIGYLADGVRSNVLHLPVLGSGDGGLFSTVDDMRRFWGAFLADRIVPRAMRELATTGTGHPGDDGGGYGHGFWLDPQGRTSLEGMDAGVSFRSVHDPVTSTTHTTISNTSAGAWPMTRALDEALGLS